MFAERDNHYQSRSGQTSLATAVTNFTKPVTNINFGPSINLMIGNDTNPDKSYDFEFKTYALSIWHWLHLQPSFLKGTHPPAGLTPNNDGGQSGEDNGVIPLKGRSLVMMFAIISQTDCGAKFKTELPRRSRAFASLFDLAGTLVLIAARVRFGSRCFSSGYEGRQ